MSPYWCISSGGKGLGSAYDVVARPAAHKQWIGEGVVIGRGAKTAAAEAFTDSFEHEVAISR